jgi:hypothetical protein
MNLSKIINHHYNVFLLDALGAFASLLLLFFLIVPNENFFGLSHSTAIYLSIPILGLLIFSTSCFFSKPQNWKLLMKFVVFGNLAYCLFTAIIILQNFKELTHLGVLYFLIEVMVIILIVRIEIATIRK